METEANGIGLCEVCGKAAREPVKALSINIVYPHGGSQSISLGGLERGSFCQEHFVRFIALKLDEVRDGRTANVPASA